MNNHPINLAVRFALEIVLLIIFAYWGWSKFNGFNKYLLVFNQGLDFGREEV